MIDHTLSRSLHAIAWARTVDAGDALRRWGLALRKLAKAKLLALRHVTLASRSPSSAVEAANVRRLAEKFLQSDPRYAAELFEAAARHERRHGA